MNFALEAAFAIAYSHSCALGAQVRVVVHAKIHIKYYVAVRNRSKKTAH